MPKFQCDFNAYGTIYVDADDAEAAREKMKSFINKDVGIDLPDDVYLDEEGTFISGAISPVGLVGEVMSADGDE